MKRINISLSDKVKLQVDELVKQGQFSTFSEAVRVGLRLVLQNYQQMADLKQQSKNWRKHDRNQQVEEFFEKY